jgi:hypothetical protein
MPRTTSRPKATVARELQTTLTDCPACGSYLYPDYYSRRTLTTLAGLVRLRLQVRRCHNHSCSLHRLVFRPETEGQFALPHHEFGLDIVALVGSLRYAQHRTVPEIHQELLRHRVLISQRSVCNLLDRYDELRSLTVADLDRLKPKLQKQGRLVLALDGLQPDVGHEVLWVVRDCLSGEVLLARSLLSARQVDLAALLKEVVDAVGVPVHAVVSDGQNSIRKAVAQALPGVPHQLCHFHYLREAGTPIYEADRHAKKELKKTVRGVRAIERQVEERDDVLAEVVQGYCAAVRSALTDDGRPPLDAKGLLLEERLNAVAASLDRLAEKGGPQNN